MTAKGKKVIYPMTMRVRPPVTIVLVVSVFAAAAIVLLIRLGGAPDDVRQPGRPIRRRNTSHRRRRQSIQEREEEPYDPYLGLLAADQVQRGLQADHTLLMSMSMSMPPSSSPSKSLTHAPTSGPSKSSPCVLDGVWKPAEDICQLMVNGGGEIEGVCDQTHRLELVTNVLIGGIDTRTLTGTKRWTKPDGTSQTVNLIGFYNEEECSFSAASTTTDMTITGRGVQNGLLQVDAIQPGGSGVAITQSGKFMHAGESSKSPSKAPTQSQSPSLEPSLNPSMSSAPSLEPSYGPTQSQSPSLEPSMSSVPSLEPSYGPTQSQSPSLESSLNPSISSESSAQPSKAPTSSPSKSQTIPPAWLVPTPNPIISQTESPTKSPAEEVEVRKSIFLNM